MDEPSVLWSTREKALSVLPPNSIGVELGVWLGEFSTQILNCVHPKKLWLVDAWRPVDNPAFGVGGLSQGHHDYALRHVKSVFDKQITSGQVIILRGLTSVVVEQFRDYMLDWVYIDANHSFDGVISDLVGWVLKVRSGGWVMGHDWVEEPPCRVKSAVQTYLAKHSELEFVGVTKGVGEKGNRPTFVLRKIV